MTYYLINSQNRDEKTPIIDPERWSRLVLQSGDEGKVEVDGNNSFLLVDDYHKWLAIYKASLPSTGAGISALLYIAALVILLYMILAYF